MSLDNLIMRKKESNLKLFKTTNGKKFNEIKVSHDLNNNEYIIKLKTIFLLFRYKIEIRCENGR